MTAVIRSVPDGAVEIQVGAYVALVDAADADLVRGYRWRPDYNPRTGKVYARAVTTGRAEIMMHRLIAGTPEGFDTDHANNDGLDNRRGNLRPATRAQNNANAVKHSKHAGKPTSSRFKGVHWDREKSCWRAAIRIQGRLKSLGRFDDESEAARAYDRALVAQHPEFARLNFPNEVAS